MGQRALAACGVRVAWLAALAVLSGAADGRAAEPAAAARGPLPLSWHAPAGCGSASEVEGRTRELLGEPELSLGGVEQVEAHVSETRSGWALNLVVRDPLGTRERRLEAEDCHDLVEAAAIAISLAVEAARAEQPPTSDAPTPASPGETDASAANASAERSSETDAEAKSGGVEPEPSADEDGDGAEIQAGAELIIDLNSLAAAAAGPSVFLALDWGELDVAAQATWLPGTNESLGPEQAIELSLLTGGVRACYALGRGLLDTAVCGGLDVGQLTVRGAGLVESRIVHDPWLSVQAGLALSRELGAGLALQARGDVVVPLLRQSYAVNETETVHHVASLGAHVALGMRVAF